MSYGTNGAWGLKAVRTITNATWNGATTPYLIASGYAQNIWKGDPVYISQATTFSNLPGYIANLYDRGGSGGTNTTFQTKAMLGASNGCEYQVPAAINPVDNANPGRPVWLSGTATVGGVPAVIQVINDPDVVYNIQTSGDTGVGATQANVGQFITLNYSLNSAGTQVQGNTQLGTSLVTANLTGASYSANTQNCYIDALSPYPGNVSGQLYNNVEALISNHYFRLMPALN